MIDDGEWKNPPQRYSKNMLLSLQNALGNGLNG